VYKTAAPYTSITAPPAPSSTSGCPALTPEFASTNVTITPPLPGHLDLYDLSYTWYCAIGAFLVITFSLIYTCLISAQDAKKVDPCLLAPWLPTVIEKLPSCFRWLPLSLSSPSTFPAFSSTAWAQKTRVASLVWRWKSREICLAVPSDAMTALRI